ncbi:hypothetical protein NON00_12870 [Roseomonas sp. GC11]|uniref:hypothetical protein n=1 Tax=Roseomonas sp. GC11 TaxID=2950546 RepID=UPI00210A7853|nr:hypothetical protein [Roseomonas sp. GC11]MCQ4160820.1 hypothetical protein [Roseomonas sp. GC11]
MLKKPPSAPPALSRSGDESHATARTKAREKGRGSFLEKRTKKLFPFGYEKMPPEAAEF